MTADRQPRRHKKLLGLILLTCCALGLVLISRSASAVAAADDDSAATSIESTEAQQGQGVQRGRGQQAQRGRGGQGQRGRGQRGRGQRGRGGRGAQGIYKTRIEPTWFPEDNPTKFWYMNNLRDNKKEFILVDAEAKTRNAAFDHARLAAGLAETTGGNIDAERLPIDAIEFADDLASVQFSHDEIVYSCNLSTYAVIPLPDAQPIVQRINVPIADSMELEPDMEALIAMEELNLTSYESEEELLAAPYVAQQGAARQGRGQGARGGAQGRGQGGQRGRGRGGQGRGRGNPTAENPVTSPDNAWQAYVQESNVYVKNVETEEVTQLSSDGAENDRYQNVQFAPDSQAIVAFRNSPGEPNPVYMVESMPDDGGPAQLRQRNYRQPGNKMDELELNVFTLSNMAQLKPEIDGQNRWDFRPGPNPRWRDDDHKFIIEKNDRGHQRYRVMEVDTHTGDVRVIIDEDVRDQNSFVWTDHTLNIGIRKVTYLDETNEIIFDSEMFDGWRHLHIFDTDTGEMTSTITPGDWVLRGVEDLDVENRVLSFRACGVYPDQDPYFIHYGRVNFDGTGLTWLTEGDGTHSIAYSPDGEYFIDSYSRVDMPPVNELRRTSDGSLVVQLEETDYSELEEQGRWNPPVVFTAKGRDGETDIWGIIALPQNFDPNTKYPVLEAIYAGPHSSFAPKNWGGERYANHTRDGYIAVKLDGMGTANRSKAFHDVCWRNIRDAGFPDRIAWMKSAAEDYPLDLERVGIYGGSAGGQNAMAALLFFGEFYKVAVANCGCHDNRIDKESWNEQWMGYRPDVWSEDEDNWFAQNSNVDNAYRLTGRLQLVVGELDTNVPPESTFRVVDRLIQAQKDFDLMVVPGGGHGAGSPITGRIRNDFLNKYLKGIEPPNYNAESAGRGDD